MRTNPPVQIDQCMEILAQYQNGARNKTLYSLRLIMRISDIVGLRTLSSVVMDGKIRAGVRNTDGDYVALDSRTKALLYVYLVQRFRQSDLSTIDPTLPLFPTSKSEYLTVERLTQLFWEMDTKIRRHSAGVSTVRASPNIGAWTTVFNHRTLDDVGSP